MTWTTQSRILKEQQIAFILKEFMDIPSGRDTVTKKFRSGSMETALGGDDALFRADRFQKTFPTKAEGLTMTDPAELGAARLRRLLTKMERQGVVTKNRVGIYCESMGDHPGWCWSYTLDETLLTNLKDKKQSIENAARIIARQMRSR